MAPERDLGYHGTILPRRLHQDADHRRGLVPLVVPITLVKHHVRRLGVAYLQGQTYLDPHPKELMLRNHV